MTMYYERYNEIRDQIIDAMVEALGQYDNEVHELLLQYEVKRWGSQVKNADEEIELSRKWMEDHLHWRDENVTKPIVDSRKIGAITVKETLLFFTVIFLAIITLVILIYRRKIKTEAVKHKNDCKEA